MLLGFRKILFKGPKSMLPRLETRDMVTWKGMFRKAPANIPKYEPSTKSWDYLSGYEIMKPVDYSGANHSFLADIDFKHPTCYKIYGVFTSSSKRIDGTLPHLIDNHLFTGKATPQFFFKYHQPKLIEKCYVEFDDLIDLRAPHLMDYFSKFIDIK